MDAENKTPGMDYKSSGVDVEKGDDLVKWIQGNQPKAWPHQERLVAGVGGFAALFRADFPSMKEPCLVSSTDGVGTKLLLGKQFQAYEGLGQDLVAMCVNDLICCGAQPLFFLDYYACGKLEISQAQKFLKGVQNACVQSDCALIGGETAEMPGVYAENDFDCAGFAVGVVDKNEALGENKIQGSETLIALSSSGFHSNGYSLLRKIFATDLSSWKDILLEPTTLYVKPVHSILKKYKVNAIANITGGGMNNLLRVIPKGCGLELSPWPMPNPFQEVKNRGGMSWESLLTTLNCGVGMVLYMPNDSASELLKEATSFQNQFGISLFEIGKVISSVEKKWTLDFKAMAELN